MKERCKCCGSKLKDVEFVSPEKKKEFMEKYGDQLQDGKPMVIPHGYLKYSKKKK